MTTKTAPLVDFHIVIEGVKHIGRTQISRDYGIHPSKLHRVLADSELVPVPVLNKHFYAEPAIREYFKSLDIKQVSE